MRRPRAVQNGVLAAALAAELILLIGHPLFGWGPKRRQFAATPPALTVTAPAPPTGRDVLRDLAATAQRQPAPRILRYRYAQVQSWNWLHQIETAGSGRQSVRYQTLTQWTDARGHGRTLTVSRTAHGFTTARATEFTPGPSPPLGVGQARLGREYHLGAHAAGLVWNQFTTVAAILAGAVTPATQAKLLRLLAQDPGTVDAGTTTDRAGRAGVAVSVTSSPVKGPSERWTLVFDRATGRLLEADDTLESPSNLIDVPVRGLISYLLVLRTGWVSRIGQVPAATGGRPLGG